MTSSDDLAADLEQLEDQVQRALAERDTSNLEVIGFGEFSVALGLGDRVAKRAPSFTRAEFAHYRAIVTDYIDHLAQSGVPTTPTTLEAVPKDNGEVVGYLVQPRHAKESVGGSLLRSTTPDAEHPLIVQIGEHIARGFAPNVGIDAQVTNWSLIDGRAELFDFGTPIWLGDDDMPKLDMAPFLRAMPAPTRWPIRLAMTDLMKRFIDPRAVLIDAVGGLLREELDEWVDPAISTWSRQLGSPISVAEAQANLKEDLRVLPLLTVAQRIQRAWVGLRRGHYDFFVQTTYGGDRLM